MKIRRLKLKNFRGYKEETEIEFDDLTVFVGKNDVGKSTILEALDIFFNEGKGTVKIDKTDVNISAARENDTETVISVVFDELPDSIIIDASHPTSLQEEYLLTQDGFLEVKKKYTNGGSVKTFIVAWHPSATNCADLLVKKNADLKRIISSNQISCDNLTVNSTMRKAIWNHFQGNLDFQCVEIDASKEDAKKIWEKLSAYMPVYSLFQADRKNSDGDSEVQDPLREAVKQILKDPQLQASLDGVAHVVKERLSQISAETLDKLNEMDPSVANTLNPVIPETTDLKWNDVFKNVSISGDEIPINKRGSGVKRLILLNFFRAEAERKVAENSSTGVIYAIEEPETSQHTSKQTLLIHALKNLASKDGVQVIVTTHSSVIVKELDFSDLRLITQDEYGIHSITSVQPGQLQYPSLNEVNYIAFEEFTVEYFNELYGYIEYSGWMNTYKTGQPLKPYNKLKQDGSIVVQQICLAEYIRHQIHHPENHNNPHYTNAELKQATLSLRDFIGTMISNTGTAPTP